MTKILAIDYGNKSVGLAISDETNTIAKTLPAIRVRNEKQALAKIKEVILEQKVKRILIGLPLNLKGEDSPQTKKARKFAAELGQGQDNISIELVDERFTSREAARLLREVKINAKKARSQIDSMSAFVMLQSYLSKFRNYV